MKRLLFCVVCLFTMSILSTADAQNLNWGYNSNPAWCPPQPRTGFEPGSYLNPYTVRDGRTGRTFTVRPTFPTFNNRSRTNDLMEPGSILNPWVIEGR